MNERRVLIIGDGAVGVAVASLLASVGYQPLFCGRHGPVAVDATIAGVDAADPVLRIAAPKEEAVMASSLMLAIIAVKAFDLAAALKFTADLPVGTPIWPIGNGAIYQELAAAAHMRPDLVWRLGYCTFGISAMAARQYAWRSRAGEFAVGAWSEAPEDASQPLPIESDLIAKLPHHFKWHNEMTWMHRRKWLFNTVINSLAASRRLPRNGDILGDLPMLVAVFNESWQLGCDLWGEWPLAKDAVYQQLIKLIEATAANENSMARDVRLGRRTESAYLAGLAMDVQRFPLLSKLHQELDVSASKNESATRR